MTGVIAHLLTAYYLMSSIAATTGTVALTVASHKASLHLRPWFAAAIPAAAGYLAVNIGRLIVDNDETLTDIARAITLYVVFILFNALPAAAARHGEPIPVALDQFVGELERKLHDTGEIPLIPRDGL